MCRRAIVAAAVWLCLAAVAAAADMPRPPCAGETVPAYPMAGEPPAVQTWFADELGADWTPDACLGWTGGPGIAVVALAGRFEEGRGMAAILSRIGAVSAYRGIQYWSVSRDIWRPLFAETWALARPERESRRGDFSAAELEPGSQLFIWQRSNEPYSGGIYRITLQASDLQRLYVDEVNIEPLTFLGMTAIPIAGQQVRLWIEAEASGHYRYYALSRLSGNLPFGLPRASAINRAVALFRYAAGMATDREPRAAR